MTDLIPAITYIEKRGLICPYVDCMASQNPVVFTATGINDVGSKPGSFWHEVTCHVCGRSWSDSYTLCGYVIVKRGEK